ncbi:MAG: fimbria/pilus outer membrane usher protein, partial [Pantoea sp.]|uniref:fimbria/pilus outer membrane usher protein n=1 Tax=Pantoea sp. TaxID=69393 RepID=UPI0039E3A71C
SLNSGLNIGPWRLRDNSVYTRYASRTTSHSRWEHVKTYAERSLIPWKSELTAGDAATSGDVFDSVGFRGIQLASDDSMYPDSARGYAPVIRGIAQSNAQVSIAQNGYTVYQTYVSAGPFEIRDLYSMASAGDLTVRIKESDGRIREFTVPYSAVPVLQRAGHYRYAVTAGQFRSGSSTERKPGFVEGTLIKGFDHDITVYGGTQLGQRYRALSLGAGLNMGDWGAISADITQANSQLADDSHHQGQSLRFLYAHAFNATGTTFQLTGYRYSTKGFYTLEESARRRMSGWADDEFDEYGRPVKHDNSAFYNLHNNRRERVVANISQSVPGFGSVYLSGTRQTYWNTGQISTVWQTGLSSSAFGATYNLSYSYSHEPGFSRPDRVLAFMVSVPLDRVFGTHHQLYATASMNRDNNGNTAVQAGLSGTALEGNNLNWSVSQGRSETENGDSGASGNAQLSYLGGYGDAGLGYSYSRHERELNYALSGGAVITRDGLTLSQPLGDTNVLIAAPGAANVRVENETGVHTDFRGYTVVPYASIYRENRISLDTGSLDDHTDMDDNVDTVVPTRGALVKARFNTHTGFRAIVTLTRQGKPLPFGTLVTHDGDTGIIGDDGQVYLSGLAMKGRLDVKWGGSAGESCSAPWAIPQSQMKAPLVVMTLPCN